MKILRSLVLSAVGFTVGWLDAEWARTTPRQAGAAAGRAAAASASTAAYLAAHAGDPLG